MSSVFVYRQNSPAYMFAFIVRVFVALNVDCRQTHQSRRISTGILHRDNWSEQDSLHTYLENIITHSQKRCVLGAPRQSGLETLKIDWDWRLFQSLSTMISYMLTVECMRCEFGTLPSTYVCVCVCVCVCVIQCLLDENAVPRPFGRETPHIQSDWNMICIVRETLMIQQGWTVHWINHETLKME